MIHDAYEGRFQLILTKEVSRFSRNILDTIAYTRELKSIGVGVLFVTDGINTLEPESEMLLSFLASLAQEESRRTSGRVVWGQTRQMERGVVFGHSLLGYDVENGIIKVNFDGAQIVRLIFHKYAVEQMTASEIARFLNAQGYKTFRGSNYWRPNYIIKILNNEKYAGDLIQKKTFTPDYLTHEKKRNRGQVPFVTIRDHHEPIISRELWDLTQVRLRSNNKHIASDRGHSNRYLFSGKIRCGVCGACFVGRNKYLKDGSKLRRWSCATAVNGGRTACTVGKLVRDDDARMMLKTALTHLQINRKAIINNVTALAVDAVQASTQEPLKNAEQITIEITRLQKKKETVMDSYFSGVITLEDMKIMKNKYETQIVALRADLSKAEAAGKENIDWESIKVDISSKIASILEGVGESDALNRTLLDKLTVFKDRHMELKLQHLPHIFHYSES